MEFITIDVAKRDGLGTAESNRLRREDRIPAVLYGMKKPNIELTIGRKDILRFLRTGSQLVELKLGDKARPAILREMQTDAVTDRILHLDFVRVDDEHEVETEVPVTFKGRAKGEGEGGVFMAVHNEVVVAARPRSLPREYIFDVSDVGLDETVTIGDLEQREGVRFLEDADFVIGTCAIPKVVEEPDEDEGATEPEVIGEKPAADESASDA